jgi:3-hydroxyacyl-[acyl-carrier-protein] dehydratase
MECRPLRSEYPCQPMRWMKKLRRNTDTDGAVVHDLDVQDICQLIPHRYPFLMVDRVLFVEPPHRARGVKNVSINEAHFQGHFPQKPVMPGVFIIEGMAQTAGVLVGVALGEDMRGKLVYFMNIESAKFRKPVVPGDQVLYDVRALMRRQRVWKIEAEATVGGVRVCEAVFAAMIVDGDTPDDEI